MSVKNDKGSSSESPCGVETVCSQEEFRSWQRKANSVVKTARAIRQALMSAAAQYPRNPAASTARDWILAQFTVERSLTMILERIEPVVPEYMSSHFAAPNLEEMEELTAKIESAVKLNLEAVPIMIAYGLKPITEEPEKRDPVAGKLLVAGVVTVATGLMIAGAVMKAARFKSAVQTLRARDAE